MRFKAKLAAEQIQLLHNLTAPLSRMTGGNNNKSFGPSASTNNGTSSFHNTLSGGYGGSVIYLDPEHLRISTRGKSGPDSDGVTCFCELATKGGIFLDHRIESAAENVIVFGIDLAQLKTALQSILEGGLGSGGRPAVIQAPLHNSSSPQTQRPRQQLVLTSSVTTMKLSKINGLPCLCLDASTGDGSVEVHHAIPVRIMRAAEMQYHLPPRIDIPDVQLELPAERPLRDAVERLKTMSPHVFIEGSMTGELTIGIDGDGASCSVRHFYSKLIPRFEDCKTSEESSPMSKCTLKVDSKKLNTCLQWQTMMMQGRGLISSGVICMVENEMLVLHVLLNPDKLGFFTYYCPVHFLSQDEMNG